MNTILLEPTDILFFRDGRPMGGASSGHGAAWPLPNVINQAFHAALHRAEFEGVHVHRRGRSGDYVETRDRKFGSLVTAGPFPVCTNDNTPTWFFPRPLDADDEGKAILFPVKSVGVSSLPKPLCYSVASSQPPSKGSLKSWWSEEAWNTYLDSTRKNTGHIDRKSDVDFSDTEHAYGIEIADDTGSVVEGQFYSAHYLRMRTGWKLGVFATATDKDFHHERYGNDLVRALLNGHGTEIIAGGQQRVCTAKLDERYQNRLPLPLGKVDGFMSSGGKHLVKWVLLTPAIFPQIEEGVSRRGTQRKAHPGGWLPTWVCPKTGHVLLQTVSEEERRRRRSLNAAGKGYASEPDIDAKLVAAMVGKPVPVTGYALPNEQADDLKGGAKPTHLAVPAGSVYYFETSEPEKLAAVLNWHGQETGDVTTIRNRRSTLFGEKGFGIGVCGTWQFHAANTPAPDLPGHPQN
jgi:CRISPR-associated protein Cmr3